MALSSQELQRYQSCPQPQRRPPTHTDPRQQGVDGQEELIHTGASQPPTSPLPPPQPLSCFPSSTSLSSLDSSSSTSSGVKEEPFNSFYSEPHPPSISSSQLFQLSPHQQTHIHQNHHQQQHRLHNRTHHLTAEFVNNDMDEAHLHQAETHNQVFHPSLDMFLINTSPSFVYSSATALSAPASATEFDLGTHFGLFDLTSTTDSSTSLFPHYPSTTPSSPRFAHVSSIGPSVIEDGYTNELRPHLSHPHNFQTEQQQQQQQIQVPPSSPSPSESTLSSSDSAPSSPSLDDIVIPVIACASCKRSHIKCDHGRPCQNCLKHPSKALTCRDAVPKPRGRPKGGSKVAAEALMQAERQHYHSHYPPSHHPHPHHGYLPNPHHGSPHIQRPPVARQRAMSFPHVLSPYHHVQHSASPFYLQQKRLQQQQRHSQYQRCLPPPPPMPHTYPLYEEPFHLQHAIYPFQPQPSIHQRATSYPLAPPSMDSVVMGAGAGAGTETGAGGHRSLSFSSTAGASMYPHLTSPGTGTRARAGSRSASVSFSAGGVQQHLQNQFLVSGPSTPVTSSQSSSSPAVQSSVPPTDTSPSSTGASPSSSSSLETPPSVSVPAMGGLGIDDVHPSMMGLTSLSSVGAMLPIVGGVHPGGGGVHPFPHPHSHHQHPLSPHYQAPIEEEMRRSVSQRSSISTMDNYPYPHQQQLFEGMAWPPMSLGATSSSYVHPVRRASVAVMPLSSLSSSSLSPSSPGGPGHHIDHMAMFLHHQDKHAERPRGPSEAFDAQAL